MRSIITMPKQNNIEQKQLLPFRHSPGVKKAVDKIAAQENLSPATLYRKIFNAGLKCLYDINIVGNEIVN